MNRADVSRIGPRSNRDTGFLELLQIRQRDFIRLIDPIQSSLWISQRVLDSLWQFVLRNLRDVERRDHFGVAPRLFFRREIQLMRKRSAVALKHYQRRTQNYVPIFQELHERLVHRFIDHAVDKHIGAFFNGRARGFQFGRVNGDANFVRVTFFNRRTRNGPKRIDRMIFVHDVPDFHQIGLLLDEFANELPRLLGSLDLHNWRIAEIKFLARNTGD